MDSSSEGEKRKNDRRGRKTKGWNCGHQHQNRSRQQAITQNQHEEKITIELNAFKKLVQMHEFIVATASVLLQAPAAKAVSGVISNIDERKKAHDGNRQHWKTGCASFHGRSWKHKAR